MPVSILLFVDDVFLISQEKCYKKLNVSLFCNYSIIFPLFSQFGLVIEHDRSEASHFSRSMKIINLPPLDLMSLGGLLLKPKDM